MAPLRMFLNIPQRVPNMGLWSLVDVISTTTPRDLYMGMLRQKLRRLRLIIAYSLMWMYPTEAILLISGWRMLPALALLTAHLTIVRQVATLSGLMLLPDTQLPV